MLKKPSKSYIICGTPRTGSTLLCSLLKSTGVAGAPESYLRKDDFGKWAREWNLIRLECEKFSYISYLEAMMAAGTTTNGVFSVRIMWGTMENLIEILRNVFKSESSSDLDLIKEAFGETKFIYIKRNDIVDQAISLFRALQTDVWHVNRNEVEQNSVEESTYDFKQISEHVKEIKEHNNAWKEWFVANKIKPYEIFYKDLSSNPTEVTKNILKSLDIELSVGRTIGAPNIKMANKINEEWKIKYLNDIK